MITFCSPSLILSSFIALSSSDSRSSIWIGVLSDRKWPMASNFNLIRKLTCGRHLVLFISLNATNWNSHFGRAVFFCAPIEFKHKRRMGKNQCVLSLSMVGEYDSPTDGRLSDYHLESFSFDILDLCLFWQTFLIHLDACHLRDNIWYGVYSTYFIFWETSVWYPQCHPSFIACGVIDHTLICWVLTVTHFLGGIGNCVGCGFPGRPCVWGLESRP